MAVPVRATARSAAADPVRSWLRNNASSSADGGNFGALPNPPRTVSSSRSAVAVASSHKSGSIAGPPPGSPEAIERSSVAMWSEACSTSPRRLRQVLVTAESSSKNAGFG
ncbi:hypothetical protein C1Y40_00947 [Mycobacterium talmoniae]|uniref:Uncharacterized protein n=1 Tax=Mycobacterium talmoniae TaxID=1858794 RepID=A0A2S8BQ82_9MYCO|nr:hypothetical protein C1Y40_00947 [Mycobacterium talmoniae]